MTRYLWSLSRCEAQIARKRRRGRIRTWLRRYWWLLLIYALVVTLLLVGCPWVGAVASEQAEVTHYVDDTPWRANLIRGYPTLPITEGIPKTYLPDWQYPTRPRGGE